MNQFKKGLFFVYKYILKDPVFLLWYIFLYPQKGFSQNVDFYTTEEVFQKIKEGKSIIRIGDGEIGMLHKVGIPYQRYEKDIAQSLKKTIQEYSDSSKYLLAIPRFATLSNEELENTKGGKECWLPLKIEYARIFNKKQKYVDAHIFYKKEFLDKVSVGILENKQLIINTTEKNCQAIKKNKVISKKVVGYIQAKTPNPFDNFKDTISKIDRLIRFNSDILLILSSGPMSKVIAYIYAERGVQSLDIGHGIEQINDNLSYEETI